MPPSKEDIMMAYFSKKDNERRIAKQSNKPHNQSYKASIDNYSYHAGKWVVVLVILSLIMVIFTGVGSLILTLIALAIVFMYYYGIKRFIQIKQTNKTKYYCTNCNQVFTGPKSYCGECGTQLNCDKNRYKCSCCGQSFIGKRNLCPYCKVKLLY